MDGWRGAAALSVVIYHCAGLYPENGRVGSVLYLGWAGVFVFFPISGYCILAAIESGRNSSIGTFLARRWRRILPPYWASVIVTVAIGLIAARVSHTSLDWLALKPWQWISFGTLTQTLFGLGDRVSPVYWSLCFEEQFYLVVALTLLVAPSLRRWLLLAVSLFAVAYALPRWPLPVPGLFLQRWAEFAAGMAVFGWSHPRFGRRWAIAQWALSGIIFALRHDPGVAISLVTSFALVALRPFDGRLARAPGWQPLMWLGTISYSVYLIHVPIAGRVINLSRHLFTDGQRPTLAITLAAIASGIVAGWVFYRVVERRSRAR